MPFVEAAPMVNVTPLKARGKSGGGGRLGVSACVYFLFLVAVAVVGKLRHILCAKVIVFLSAVGGHHGIGFVAFVKIV